MKKLIFAIMMTLVSGLTQANNERIVFDVSNLANPFEVFMQRTAIQTAKQMKVNLQVLDSQSHSAKQVADLENALTAGAHGFIVLPNDVNAISVAIRGIQNAGVPIVTLDRSANTVKKVPHFGADNYQGGYAIAEYVKTQLLNGGDIILISGQPGSSPNIERMRGIHDSLTAGGVKYHIVAEQSGNWMRSQGMRIVESLLPALAQPPQAIIAANDDMALGAIEALKSLGLQPGQIVVTGFDAVPEALRRVDDGWLSVTADQRPGYSVRVAITQMVENIRENKAIQGDIYPPLLITKKNIQQAERHHEARL